MIRRLIGLPGLMALVAMMALMGIAATSGVSAQELTDPPAYICHAAGKSGKFVKVPANEAGDVMGHYGDGHQWGNDIIPPTTYQNATVSQNWNELGQAIYFNDCQNPTPVLVYPAVEVTEATCDTAASITPIAQPGVSYVVEGVAAPGAVVTVYASVDNAFIHTFGPPPAGWVFNAETGEMSFTVEFDPAPDCRTELTPISPTIIQATCDTMASWQPADGPAGISYSVTGEVAAGNNVTVTATITDPAANKMAMLADPWTRVSDTVATQSVTFTVPDCPLPTDVPGETPTPSPTPTVTPTATVTPTVTPTSTVPPRVTETPTATVPPTVTVPPTGTVPPTATVAPKPVTSLPDTGSGQDAIGSGLLILASGAALAVIALGVNRSKKA